MGKMQVLGKGNLTGLGGYGETREGEEKEIFRAIGFSSSFFFDFEFFRVVGVQGLMDCQESSG